MTIVSYICNKCGKSYSSNSGIGIRFIPLKNVPESEIVKSLCLRCDSFQPIYVGKNFVHESFVKQVSAYLINKLKFKKLLQVPRCFTCGSDNVNISFIHNCGGKFEYKVRLKINQSPKKEVKVKFYNELGFIMTEMIIERNSQEYKKYKVENY